MQFLLTVTNLILKDILKSTDKKQPSLKICTEKYIKISIKYLRGHSRKCELKVHWDTISHISDWLK